MHSPAWLVVQFTSRFQYVPQPLDAAFATKALRVYLRALDPQRLFFSARDVAAFEAQGSELPSMLFRDDLSVPRAMASRHAELATQRLEHAIALLDQGFDSSSSETEDATVADDAPFLTSAALDERWRRIVKNDWQQLKSAGKNDAQIRTLLSARYKAFARHIQTADTDRMQMRFLDAYAMASGQGSQYFAEPGLQFAVMTHLGMVISSDADGPMVNHVSPSILRTQGQIRAGDRLIGITVDNGDTVYLDGWQTPEVKSLLEGVAAGATVHLLLRRHDAGPDGPVENATLTARAEAFRDAASLRMVTASGPTGGQVAVINLPTFYLDAEARQRGAKDYDSSARDLEKMLVQAQQSGATGVVLDLRGNGGGSLPAAADVASLFVGKRPLWRTRNARGEVEDIQGTRDEPLWTGPLAVLVDQASAEGAELVAAALQDNQRALVVGKRSMGAGNIASAIDLNRFPHDAQTASNGMLKLTIATTFRANGNNISGHGVVPDLELPLAPAFSSFDGPPLVTFDKLPSTTLQPMLNLQGALPALRRDHVERTTKLAGWSDAQHAVYPDDDDLLGHIASILVDEKRLLDR